MGFFKAYDMRGTFGADFDLDTVYKVGRALPGVIARADLKLDAGGASALPRPRILVGRDCRTTSKDVRDSLVRGLEDGGASVFDLGPSTTPMVYFFTAEDGYDGSIMVTASHNPPSDNGLKVSMRTALPIGYANGLDEVERAVMGGEAEGSLGGEGTAEVVQDSVERYVAWMAAKVPAADFAGLKFAVDCSNGMASMLARRLFPSAVILNDVPDGAFPAHSPNPLKADAREQISRVVREQGLDCGVIFDGDADRAMFVDENGEFVQPDYLIPIVAEACSRCGESRIVLHDVRTSRGVIETLSEKGFEPVMVPVGHAFAKPEMRKRGALCGGELAGHYYFGDFFGCDSGALAALRILSRAAQSLKSGVSFSGMVRPISSRYANSGEMNFKVEDKDAAIARVLATAAVFGAERGRCSIDGVRLEFDGGWISVRKSNTEPYLRLLVEHRSKSGLEEWVGALGEAVDGR